jgi:hypothetical protein
MPDLVGSPFAIAALLGFAVAYAFVIAEEFTGLRKSKAMVFMAGLIWVLVGIAAREHGIDAAESARAQPARICRACCCSCWRR